MPHAAKRQCLANRAALSPDVVRWRLRKDVVGLRVDLTRASACDLQKLARKLAQAAGGSAHGALLGQENATLLVAPGDVEGITAVLKMFVAEHDSTTGLFTWDTVPVSGLRKAEVADCLRGVLTPPGWTDVDGVLYRFAGDDHRYATVALTGTHLSDAGVFEARCTAGVSVSAPVSLPCVLSRRLQEVMEQGGYADLEYEEDVDRSCTILPTLQRALIQGVCRVPPVYDALGHRYLPAAEDQVDVLAAKLRKRFKHHFGLDPTRLPLPPGGPYYVVVAYPFQYCTTTFEPWHRLGHVIPAELVRFTVTPMRGAPGEGDGAFEDFHAEVLRHCKCLA